jgi:uncharacterized protein (DUF2141 family)
VVLAALLGAQPGLAEAPQSASLEVTVTGIKNAKGVIQLAICPANAGFPDCKGKVVRSAKLTIVNSQAYASFSGLAAGSYAVSVFHDVNSNGKLDTFAGIPKEGYGFSRNPGFKPRAPKFSEAELVVQGNTKTSIKLRYLL